MTYFRNVNTLEELRKQYKELVRQYRSTDRRKKTTETSIKKIRV